VSQDRALDVVVFGATGFVGRLTADYLAGHLPAGVRVGLAGRSHAKLEQLRASLGKGAEEWPILLADSGDPGSLAELAAATRVVATTVGPYRTSGPALVEACAAAGTDYADLTGEILFMRECIDRFDGMAVERGARIVHSCGFDSIPSDLGVLSLHQAAAEDEAGDLEDVVLVLTAVKGGLSGGTFASLEGELDDVRASAESRRIVDDPYALSPDRASEPDLGNEADLRGVERNDELGIWLGPFVMASINTRAVRRSNALQGWAYGRRFRYREVMGFAGPLGPVKAAGVSGAAWALQAGLAHSAPRKLLDRLLPDPGEGPSERLRQTGFFRIEIHARTSTGARYVCRIAAQGDPGYAATAVMLGESALCLALDPDGPIGRAGVLTPATAMGAVLAERLRAADFTLEVERRG
jgi:short subunit dehydrogenase-like uncharacterized protein